MKQGKAEYIRGDHRLRNDSIRAGKLLQQFNQVDYEAMTKKIEILTELFGSVA
jgi:hypothetical protein